MEYDMKRNGSGYYDETAHKAFEIMANAGEIWTVGLYGGGEKEVLVIKNHGDVCNVLTLLDEKKGDGCIEIASRSLKYTDPKMLQYQFKSGFGYFVKKLPDATFDYVLAEIEDALGFGGERMDAKAKEELEMAKNTVKALEAELCEMKAKAAEQSKQAAPADAHYKDLYQKLVFDLIDRGLMGVVML